MVKKRSRSSSSSDCGRVLSEEKIACYMVRKAQKKAARVVAAGYHSNASNPFGDSNLSEKFVWKKKIERDVSVHGGTSYSCVYNAEKRRQKEIMAEIEKLKKRREERVVEKAARQSSGRREGDQFEVDWEKKEKEFELEQSKLRSAIRLREGRAKPIDILTKHLNVSTEDDDLDLDLAMEEPPYMVFKGLTVKEIEEIRDDIITKLNLDLDLEVTDQHYWKAVLEVCNWELTAAVREEEIISCSRGLHPSIEEDVRDYLQSKTHKELEEIQWRVEAQLNSGRGKVVEFWQVLLKQIQLYKAKAFLREFHNSKIMHLRNHHPSNLQQPTDDFAAAAAAASIEEEDEDAMELVDANYDDLIGLRKPKYENRVHSGYVWNKYNQTHYDHDNPPPKIVKGYKFNIFYPDLVDKTKAPTYTIEKDDEGSCSGEQTCIIRFHAGLPYQDIAFRIVNDDWELSLKKGFNCSFHNGILRLYFNFKRYPYRR